MVRAHRCSRALGPIIKARTKQQIDNDTRASESRSPTRGQGDRSGEGSSSQEGQLLDQVKKVLDEYPQMKEREKKLKHEVQQLQQERNRSQEQLSKMQQECNQAQGERDRLQMARLLGTNYYVFELLDILPDDL